MADERIDGVAEESAPQASRTQRLIDLFRRSAEGSTETQSTNPRSVFADKIQKLHKGSAEAWNRHAVKQLARLAANALADAAKQSKTTDPSNPYAQHQALESTRAQMRQMLFSLQPPPEVADSPEFQELMETLKPRAAKIEDSRFDRKSMMAGKVRSDILTGQVQEAVKEAERRTTQKRIDRLTKAGADRVTIENATRSLTQMVRLMRRKKKKKAGQVSDPDAVETDEADFTSAEIDELANVALEVMQTLREEIAPRWAPSQQPWLINAADNEVFSILLALVPKELFEETEAFQAMQDLRAGQEVFTLRAADRTTDAIRRK